MSLLADLKKLKKAMEPKPSIRFIRSESEIDESPGAIWVLLVF